MSPRSKVLVVAYACEPESGSEPGAGWMWVRMLSVIFPDVWVITRANNRLVIEEALGDVPELSRTNFVYLDLPRWISFWKRGQRGIRLYYFLWQLRAVRLCRSLVHDHQLSMGWHLTLANAWFGSPLAFAGIPFVFGPVGGGVDVPPKLRSLLPLKDRIAEGARALVRFIGRHVNPFSRATLTRARAILVQNEETLKGLPLGTSSKATVFPNPVIDLEPLPARADGVSPNTALFAGRFLAWKGPMLALEAVAAKPSWTLWFCGEGPYRSLLQDRVDALGVSDRVHFLGWKDRPEVLRIMRESSVLLFPSLREEAGWVVAEAVHLGVPVIALDQGGPREIVARPELLVEVDGADHVVQSIGNKLDEIAALAGSDEKTSLRSFDIDSRTEHLRRIVERVFR